MTGLLSTTANTLVLKDITIWLADWSDYLALLVALLSLLTYRSNGYFRLLTSYLFFIAILHLATTVTANYRVNNSYIYHAIGFAELTFAFLLYRRSGIQDWWIWLFLIVSAAYLTDSLYLMHNDILEINSIGQSIAMLFIILLGFNFLWKLYQEEKVDHIGRYPYFYIHAGLTFFAAGSFFGYLLIARLSGTAIPDENFYYSWLIISGFAYIKFALIASGILIQRRYAK